MNRKKDLFSSSYKSIVVSSRMNIPEQRSSFFLSFWWSEWKRTNKKKEKNLGHRPAHRTGSFLTWTQCVCDEGPSINHQEASPFFLLKSRVALSTFSDFDDVHRWKKKMAVSSFLFDMFTTALEILTHHDTRTHKRLVSIPSISFPLTCPPLKPQQFLSHLFIYFFLFIRFVSLMIRSNGNQRLKLF